MTKQHLDRMIKNQIEARGISDERLLKAMGKIERHRFIPGAEMADSYGDHPVPIGHGQTISQPYIVALMTELCQLREDDRVLEIGTGSGYQTAVLSELVKEVYTIEIVEELAKTAEKRLTQMGYDNIRFRAGDGYKGWEEHAPFDVILLTAAPPEIPEKLVAQLSDDNGRMIAPVGSHQQELIRITKTGSTIEKEFITYVRFVPMVKSKETIKE